MSCLLVEKEPGAGQTGGLTVPPQLEKLGYKGVETTELVFADHRVPAANLLGGVEGQGFQQMMSGVEVGRVNVAARGVGVAQRAFELASATPRSGKRSASRSPSTRASSSSWPRWRPRSRPPGC